MQRGYATRKYKNGKAGLRSPQVKHIDPPLRIDADHDVDRLVAAVRRHRIVGRARRPLQPEATGAAMESSNPSPGMHSTAPRRFRGDGD